MKLETVREKLASIPEVRQESEDENQDLLGIATAFTTVLRKLGVQQMRDSRDLLAAIQAPQENLDQVRDAWQREQRRAAESERQLGRLADVLIALLDSMERMRSLLEKVPGMSQWSRQLDQAIDLCQQDSKRNGLVTLAAAGDAFNPEVHDLGSAAPSNGDEIRIASVAVQGYTLNGRILRRATVLPES